MEIQSCIKSFMFIKHGNCCLFFRYILFTVLFHSFSSSLALLPACWRLLNTNEKEESVYTKDRGNSVSRHRRFFFKETFILVCPTFGTFSLRKLLNTRYIDTPITLYIIFVIKIFVMLAESRNSRKYCSPKIWSYTVNK